MKKILSVLAVFTLVMISVTSCYNNKYDILEIPKVSFVNEVVPIMTAGPCGCHNLEGATNITQFSNGHGEIHYSTIYARGDEMRKWAQDSIPHPGGGTVYLSPRDKQVLILWAKQKYPNDYVPEEVSGLVTYSSNMVKMVTSTCAGGACHSSARFPLTYDLLKNKVSNLQTMANSGGSAGHPGGAIPLPPNDAKTILAWITQGTKQ